MSICLLLSVTVSRSGRKVFSYLFANVMKVLEDATSMHDFCINLSFSRYISYICKEALHGLPLFDFVYSFPALFKKVLLWHYWSIHKESLPLHLLKNALIFVKTKG